MVLGTRHKTVFVLFLFPILEKTSTLKSVPFHVSRRLQQKYPSHLTKKLVPSNQYPCMSFVVPESFSDGNFPYFQEMFKDLKEQLQTIFKPLSGVLHVSRDQIILVKHCQPLCLQMARGGAT